MSCFLAAPAVLLLPIRASKTREQIWGEPGPAHAGEGVLCQSSSRSDPHCSDRILEPNVREAATLHTHSGRERAVQ